MSNVSGWMYNFQKFYPYDFKINSFKICIFSEHHEHSDVLGTVVVNRSTNGIGFWLTTRIKENVEEFSWIGSYSLHAAPVDVGRIR